jgi:hypothetical protein
MPSRSVWYHFLSPSPMGFRDFFDFTSQVFKIVLSIVWRIVPYNFEIKAKVIYRAFFKLGITIQYFEYGGESKKNLETPWGMVLESGTKLTVRASAITTTRKCVWYRRSLDARFQTSDLGFIITSTVGSYSLACVGLYIL